MQSILTVIKWEARWNLPLTLCTIAQRKSWLRLSHSYLGSIEDAKTLVFGLLEKTYTGMKRTCRQHTERPQKKFDPGTFLLWGDNPHHLVGQGRENFTEFTTRFCRAWSSMAPVGAVNKNKLLPQTKHYLFKSIFINQNIHSCNCSNHQRLISK